MREISGTMAPRPKPEDYMALQQECKAIAEPFVRLMVEAYKEWTTPIVYSPTNPNVLPAVLEPASIPSLRAQMMMAIEEHISCWASKHSLEAFKL